MFRNLFGFNARRHPRRRSAAASSRQGRRTAKPRVEPLETRLAPACQTIPSPVLLISCDAGRDSVALHRVGDEYVVTTNGTVTRVRMDRVNAIVIGSGGGGDTISLMQASPNLANFGNRSVEINGGGDAATLLLHDQQGISLPRPQENRYELDTSVVRRPGLWGIGYSQVNTLVLNGVDRDGAHVSTFCVLGTSAQTTINGGVGTDIFNAGCDNGNLDNLRGGLTVNGAGGENSLHAIDTYAPRSQDYGFVTDTLSRTGAAPIRYLNLAGVNLYTATNYDNTITVASMGTNVAVRGGDRSDHFIVGTPNRSMDDIRFGLTLLGRAGHDTVDFRDENADGSHVYTLFKFPESHPLLARRSNGGVDRYVGYVDIEGLVLNASNGSDIVNIRYTAPGTRVTINAGDGNDVLNVSNEQDGRSEIGAELYLNGQGGHDRIDIYDHGTPGDHAYFITDSSVSRSRLSQPYEFRWVGYADVEQLNMRTSSGNDFVSVDSTAARTPVWLHGWSGNDILMGSSLDCVWAITGGDAGSLSGPLYPAGVSFSGFENLVGGAGNDAFVFANGAGIAGWIVDVGGSNTLNYTAYTTDVFVHLMLGRATGTGGAWGFRNVTGGQRNDIVIGDTRPNLLRGGPGRDLLIGGYGVDVLQGEEGDDILIGGHTVFDWDPATLFLIMAEWTRTDPGSDYWNRANNVLRYLNASTVTSDGDNRLLGGAGEDLFYVCRPLDTGDWGPGEIVVDVPWFGIEH